MAATIVTISASDNGGTAAAVPVTATIVSTAIGLLNGAGASVQRTRTTATAGDGTLSLPLDPNSDLSDTASTYTIQVGTEVYGNIVVPASGPVTLASLVATAVNRTVAITLDVVDPSQLPDAGLVATAALSIDSINLSAQQVLAQIPVPATSDVTGLLTWHLCRTDQLTPVGGGPEPYYAFIVGSSIYYRYVRGAGSLSSLTPAIPTTSSGGYGADASSLAAVENTPTSLHGSPSSIQDVLDDAIYRAEHAVPLAGGTMTGELVVPDLSVTGLAGSVAGARYVGSTASGAPASGAHRLGDWATDQAGKRWTCTVAGTPGTWAQEPGTGGLPAGGLTGQTIRPIGGSGAWTYPAGQGGAILPLIADGDLLVRRSRTVASLALGILGDSIYASSPSGGVEAGPTLGAALATALSVGGITVTAYNQAHGGARSQDWLSGGAYLTAAMAAWAGSGVRLVTVMLGTNDASHYNDIAPATYGANIRAMCATLVAAGYIPVLHMPIYAVPGSQSGQFDAVTNARIVAYQAQILSLVNGDTILLGDTTSYAAFAASPSWLGSPSDGVHPNSTGDPQLAALHAAALTPYVNALTGAQVWDRATLGSGLTLSGGVLSASGGGAGGVYGPIGNGTGSPLILNANNQIILSRRA